MREEIQKKFRKNNTDIVCVVLDIVCDTTKDCFNGDMVLYRCVNINSSLCVRELKDFFDNFTEIK